MSIERTAERVVNGFKLPSDGQITENEQTWVEFLRII